MGLWCRTELMRFCRKTLAKLVGLNNNELVHWRGHVVTVQAAWLGFLSAVFVGITVPTDNAN